MISNMFPFYLEQPPIRLLQKKTCSENVSKVLNKIIKILYTFCNSFPFFL